MLKIKVEIAVLWTAAALLLVATLPAQTPAPAGDVTGVGNFSHIVANLERSVEFYRDVLGLELTAQPRPFDPNPAIMRMGNTIGAQSRIAVLRVPGSAIGVELIDYKDIDRQPAHPRFQDPGAGNLILRIADLDGTVARLKKSGAHILTAGDGPATVRGTRVLFAQDPDGFVVELSQAGAAGGGFEAVAENLERTAAFYRLLGFESSAPAAWNGDKLMTDTAGTPGAQFRQSRAPIPGTSATVTFIEFKDIDRKPLHTRIQDPGTAILQLMVRDVDGLLVRLKAGGATVVSVGGEAVNIGANARIAIVRDPNNLFLELIQRKGQP